MKKALIISFIKKFATKFHLLLLGFNLALLIFIMGIQVRVYEVFRGFRFVIYTSSLTTTDLQRTRPHFLALQGFPDNLKTMLDRRLGIECTGGAAAIWSSRKAILSHYSAFRECFKVTFRLKNKKFNKTCR